MRQEHQIRKHTHKSNPNLNKKSMIISHKNRLATLFTVLGILLLQNAFCQENFISGFILPNKGDTVRGLIDYRDWENNPDKIYFKTVQSSSKKGFQPNDIISFGVNGAFYESAKVQMEMSNDNTAKLTLSKELILEVDAVFLETLVQGEKSLYSYKNKDIKTQFYVKNNNSFDLLIFKKYLKEDNNQTIISENKLYLNQLAVYLSDMPNLQSKLSNVGYNANSLKQLFSYYYQKMPNNSKFQKNIEKVAFDWGIFTGLSVYNVKFESNTFPELVNGNFTTSMSPLAGVSMDIVLPKKQKRWSFQNEIMYNSIKTTGQYVDRIDTERFVAYDITFDFAYLKLINMIRYRPVIGKMIVYINAGISNGLAFKSTKNFQKRTKLFSFDTIETKDPLGDVRTFEQGYVLGIGAKYKKYNFEIRNERANGMSDYVNLSSSTNRWNFMAGYSF